MLTEFRMNRATWAIAAGLLAAALVVVSPLADAEPAFVSVLVGSGVDETHSARGADFDGDGDVDVVATDYVDGQVLWFENTPGGFVTRILDGDLAGAYPIDVADVDQDGDTDVLAAGYLADTVVWYENNGSAVFTKRVVDVGPGADGAHSVVTGDMDGDGDLDLLTTNQDGHQVAWYANDGAENFGSAMVIDSYPLMNAKRAEFVDMDDDGDMDVVAGSFGEPPVPSGEVAWYENNGAESFTKHVLIASADFEGVYSVTPIDIDNDGDQDVAAVSQLDNAVAIFVNNGAEVFTTQVIDAAALGARTVRAADIDADGLTDLLVNSVDDDTVAWHRNIGGGSFTKISVDTGAAGAYGVSAADLDNDGDLDILSAHRDSGQIKVYYQQGVGAGTVGLVEPGARWHLRRADGSEHTFVYGNPGDLPLLGDWDGDGVDTPGMFRPVNGFVYLTNTVPSGGGVGLAERSFFFGNPGDLPLVGDWDGDGSDSLGVYRDGHIFLANALETGFADVDFWFGVPGDRPFTGDFDADGFTDIGLFRPTSGFVYMRYEYTSGFADHDFYFGLPGDQIIAGDWNNDDTDTVGVWRPSAATFYLANANDTVFADITFAFGASGWTPVAGHWQ